MLKEFTSNNIHSTNDYEYVSDAEGATKINHHAFTQSIGGHKRTLWPIFHSNIRVVNISKWILEQRTIIFTSQK